MSWPYAVWTGTEMEEGSGLWHSVAAAPSVPWPAAPGRTTDGTRQSETADPRSIRRTRDVITHFNIVAYFDGIFCPTPQ